MKSLAKEVSTIIEGFKLGDLGAGSKPKSVKIDYNKPDGFFKDSLDHYVWKEELDPDFVEALPHLKTRNIERGVAKLTASLMTYESWSPKKGSSDEEISFLLLLDVDVVIGNKIIFSHTFRHKKTESSQEAVDKLLDEYAHKAKSTGLLGIHFPKEWELVV